MLWVIDESYAQQGKDMVEMGISGSRPICNDGSVEEEIGVRESELNIYVRPLLRGA